VGLHHVLDAGESLVVRAFRREDAAGVLEAVRESGSDVSRFEIWAREPFTPEKAAEYVGWWIDGWADGSATFFALIEQDRFLGACGLFTFGDNATASMGYWIRTSSTGRGVATRAALAVSTFGFEDLGLSAIDMRVSDANPASIRVAQKVNAHRIGPAADVQGLAPGDEVSSVYRLDRPATHGDRC